MPHDGLTLANLTPHLSLLTILPPVIPYIERWRPAVRWHRWAGEFVRWHSFIIPTPHTFPAFPWESPRYVCSLLSFDGRYGWIGGWRTGVRSFCCDHILPLHSFSLHTFLVISSRHSFCTSRSFIYIYFLFYHLRPHSGGILLITFCPGYFTYVVFASLHCYIRHLLLLSLSLVVGHIFTFHFGTSISFVFDLLYIFTFSHTRLISFHHRDIHFICCCPLVASLRPTSPLLAPPTVYFHISLVTRLPVCHTPFCTICNFMPFPCTHGSLRSHVASLGCIVRCCYVVPYLHLRLRLPRLHILPVPLDSLICCWCPLPFYIHCCVVVVCCSDFIWWLRFAVAFLFLCFTSCGIPCCCSVVRPLRSLLFPFDFTTLLLLLLQTAFDHLPNSHLHTWPFIHFWSIILFVYLRAYIPTFDPPLYCSHLPLPSYSPHAFTAGPYSISRAHSPTSVEFNHSLPHWPHIYCPHLHHYHYLIWRPSDDVDDPGTR